MPDRQTIDIVKHPDFGEGFLRWENGPATFTRADGSDPMPLAKVGHGGSSSNPRMEWRSVVVKPGDAPLRFEIIERGDSHARCFSSIFGIGWLVTEWSRYDREGWWMRFESDEGKVHVRFSVREVCTGTPSYKDKMRRAGTRMPKTDDLDEMNWTTFTTKDGSTLVFRGNGPPPGPDDFIEIAKHDLALLSKKALADYRRRQLIKEGRGNPNSAASSDEQVEARQAKLAH